MKKVLNPLLLLMLALPAYGQDQPAETPAEAPPADAAPADAAPADAAPADSGTVIDSIATDAAAESTPAEPEEIASIPVDAPVEAGTPLRLYGGIDWVRNTLSTSGVPGFGSANYETGMYRLRFGTKVFDQLGIEGHYGVNRSVDQKTGADTDDYYGLFVVPNAVLFNTVELAFPVGYAKYKVKRGSAKDSLSSVAYGLNIELPLRLLTPDLPDFRFVVGGMIYSQSVAARVYGYHAGLRYDFDIARSAPSAPSTGPGFGEKVGGFFKKLWPFGKDEAAPQ